VTLIRMAGNRAPFGFWLMTPNESACEIASILGFGTAIIDMEHGSFEVSSAARAITVCKALGLAVSTRVGSPERVPIQHALDFGSDGVILPQITGLDHAKTAAAFAKYPPLGSRGFGGGKTVSYLSVPRHFVEAENSRTKCWAMIETASALEQVAQIAALETIDGLFIGPNDLSLARGRGEYSADGSDHTDIERIAMAARRAGKPWGMPIANNAGCEFATSLGAAFMAITDDRAALRDGFEMALRRMDEDRV
jgi:2-dehydro-3-deoxyglucarate aldolase